MTVAADVAVSWYVSKVQSSMVCVVVVSWMIDHQVVVVLVVCVSLQVVVVCRRNVLAVPNTFLSQVFLCKTVVSIVKS